MNTTGGPSPAMSYAMVGPSSRCKVPACVNMSPVLVPRVSVRWIGTESDSDSADIRHSPEP